MPKTADLALLESSKLISRKVPVIQKSLNFHTVKSLPSSSLVSSRIVTNFIAISADVENPILVDTNEEVGNDVVTEVVTETGTEIEIGTEIETEETVEAADQAKTVVVNGTETVIETVTETDESHDDIVIKKNELLPDSSPELPAKGLTKNPYFVKKYKNPFFNGKTAKSQEERERESEKEDEWEEELEFVENDMKEKMKLVNEMK